MKHLKIEVNGQEWVNGDFSEISFTDGPNGVRIEAKPVRSPSANGNSGGILEMLTKASRSRTEAISEQKRAAAQEAAVEVVDLDLTDPASD